MAKEVEACEAQSSISYPSNEAVAAYPVTKSICTCKSVQTNKLDRYLLTYLLPKIFNLKIFCILNEMYVIYVQWEGIRWAMRGKMEREKKKNVDGLKLISGDCESQSRNFNCKWPRAQNRILSAESLENLLS